MIAPVVEKNEEGRAIIKVVGVGGGGVNAVNSMIAAGVQGVEFIAMNTDVQHLDGCLAERTLRLCGPTKGRGAGGDPEQGREAALQEREAIADALRGADMVVIAAVFGGGTGTGASTVVAEVARSLGILTAAVVTLPFTREGRAKRIEALNWLDVLKKSVDAYAIIENDHLKKMAPKGISSLKLYQLLDHFLGDILTGLVELVVHRAYINRDLEDVRKVLQNAGRFLIGIGSGEGEQRAQEAVERALGNPLLEHTNIEGARAALVHIAQGPEGQDDEVDIVMDKTWEHLSPDAKLWYGWDWKPELEGRIKVTIIASRFAEVGDVDATSLVEVDEAVSRVMPRDVRGIPNYAARPVLSDQAGLDRVRAMRHPSREMANRHKALDEGPSELDPMPAFMRTGSGRRLGEGTSPSELGAYYLCARPGSGPREL